MKTKQIVRPLILVVGILLIPALAMFFSVGGWSWKISDFIIMGSLILGTGLLIEAAHMKIKNKNQRIIVIGLIVLALVLLYIHLAVGIVDTWPLAGS